YRRGTESFFNDIALLKLHFPVAEKYKPIALCRERLPYTYKRNLLGTCGIGSIHRIIFETPDVLQETVFYESMYISESSPFSFHWCRSDLVCVDAVIKGSNICKFDGGSPLYTFHCGTRIPDCLYGVASFYRNRENRPGTDHCDSGSFFASIFHLYEWIEQTLTEN
ncbi:kallikrein 1-related peptidase b8-like, partial [Convolutriloba macropyga]|uniref:kallikrein 1-related peptidase b8-like n=1 Tax=Convolutriloba macropyga TaxID=536237 RepID=UPI003F5268E0